MADFFPARLLHESDASLAERVDSWHQRNPAPSASPAALTDALRQIGAILGPGSNELHTLLVCIRNIKHFADCLDAVEREFFMVPGEPDEDDPDGEPSDECLLNRWGSTVEQYVEQFRAAIPHLLTAAPADQGEDARDAERYRWLRRRVVMMDCSDDVAIIITAFKEEGPSGEFLDDQIDSMSATPPAA